MKRSKLFVVVSLCLTILVCIFFSVYKAFSEEKLMNVNDNIPIQEDRGDEEVNEPDTTPSVIEEEDDDSFGSSNNEPVNDSNNQSENITNPEIPSNSSSFEEKPSTPVIEEKPSDSSSSVTEEPKNPVKIWTDVEIEEFARQTVTVFRLDFKSVAECEAKGNEWMNRGWRYDCIYVPIPETDIVATMLNVTSGEYYCDNAFTDNLSVNWKNYSSPISVIAYLRENGFPCTNLEDIY